MTAAIASVKSVEDKVLTLELASGELVKLAIGKANPKFFPVGSDIVGLTINKIDGSVDFVETAVARYSGDRLARLLAEAASAQAQPKARKARKASK